MCTGAGVHATAPMGALLGIRLLLQRLAAKTLAAAPWKAHKEDCCIQCLAVGHQQGCKHALAVSEIANCVQCGWWNHCVKSWEGRTESKGETPVFLS